MESEALLTNRYKRSFLYAAAIFEGTLGILWLVLNDGIKPLNYLFGALSFFAVALVVAVFLRLKGKMDFRELIFIMFNPLVFAEAFLHPYNLCLTAVFILCIVLILKKKKLFFIFTACVLAVSWAVPAIAVPIRNNTLPNTPGTGLMCTFAARHLEEDYCFFPEAVKEDLSFDKLSEAVKDKELARNIIGEALIPERNPLSLEGSSLGIAFASIGNRSRESIMTFAKGTLEYFFWPFTVVLNIKGVGESLTSLRLLDFRGLVPYVSLVYFFASLFLSFVWIGMGISGSREFFRKRKIYYLFPFVFWIFESVLFGLISLNDFDYIKMIPSFLVALLFF